MVAQDLAIGIEASARAHGVVGRVDGLRRLTGGASKEIWAFDLTTGDEPLKCVARLGSGAARFNSAGIVSLTREAELLRVADRHGIPVPKVLFHLLPEAGDGYVVEYLAGETRGGRILGDPSLEDARAGLAHHCGQILAGIHAVPPDEVSFLDRLAPGEALEILDLRYRRTSQQRAAFEFALRWLQANLAHSDDLTFLHGDFRNGNLMIGASGLSGVLDWETAHIGHPAEDLGWLCVPSWRFGRPDLPVGGFGRRDELLEGYRAAGGRSITIHELKAWEVYGVLRWGIMCAEVGARFQSGVRSVEGALIARRVSEAEYDLIRLIRNIGHKNLE